MSLPAAGGYYVIDHISAKFIGALAVYRKLQAPVRGLLRLIPKTRSVPAVIVKLVCVKSAKSFGFMTESVL